MQPIAWLVKDQVGLWKVAWDGGSTHGAIPVFAKPCDLLRTIDSVAAGLEADGRTADGMTKVVAAKKLRASMLPYNAGIKPPASRAARGRSA